MIQTQERCACGTILEKKFKGSLTKAEKELSKGEQGAAKRFRSKADLICPNCGKGYTTWKPEQYKRKEEENNKRKETYSPYSPREQKGISGYWALHWQYCSTYIWGT